MFGEDDEAGDSEELEKARQAGENCESVRNRNISALIVIKPRRLIT